MCVSGVSGLLSAGNETAPVGVTEGSRDCNPLTGAASSKFTPVFFSRNLIPSKEVFMQNHIDK